VLKALSHNFLPRHKRQSRPLVRIFRANDQDSETKDSAGKTQPNAGTPWVKVGTLCNPCEIKDIIRTRAAILCQCHTRHSCTNAFAAGIFSRSLSSSDMGGTSRVEVACRSHPTLAQRNNSKSGMRARAVNLILTDRAHIGAVICKVDSACKLGRVAVS
jgi:hypothetical protein